MTQHERLRAAVSVLPTTFGLWGTRSAGKPRPHGDRGRQRSGRGQAFLVERIESRVLLSAATTAAALRDHMVHTTWVAYHPPGQALHPGSGGDIQPFATSSPTGLTPAQMRHAYGVDQINFNGTVGDGTGQTIGIVDAFDQPNAASDLNTFSQQFGLPLMNQPGGPTFTKIAQDGSSNLPSPAPTSQSGGWGVEESLDIEWAHSIAPEANIVLVEASTDATVGDLMVAVDEAAKYPGVSVVSMSWGDFEKNLPGESSYDSQFVTPAGHIPVTFFASTGDSGQPGVYPAFSPNVVAVGGTTLNVDSSGNYLSESGWSGSGGGISTQESQPDYQSGKVSQSTTNRAIPDISMDADPQTGVPVYDTYDFGNSTPWAQFGGTSLASPMAAALVSIADQGSVLQGGTTLDGRTNALPDIYAMSANNFHDITSGNNGFAAGPGYDLVTGIGSPANSFAVTLSGFKVQHLAFAQQPTNTTAGATITPAVTVDVLDAQGRLLSSNNSNVTLQLVGNGTLNGTLTVAAVNGVATFSDLSINQAGSYDLDASDSTFADAISNSFNINPTTANKLVYIQQPTTAVAGGTIYPPVAVAVEDKFGNIETNDGSTVTIALASGSGTLSGTLMRPPSSGVASFNDLSIQPDGTYSLIATDGSLTSATSVSFAITPAPPKLLAINRLAPIGPITSDNSVEFQVLFSEPVTGVSASSFTLAISGVTATTPVVVSGSGSTYTVTVNGISAGNGSLGLNLNDNGTIKNGSGQTLQGSNVSFQPQHTFGAGTGPAAVAVADLNGDGKPDMVVANYGTLTSYGQTVSVLLGNGDGTFQPQKTFSVGQSPNAVAIADVNGDGNPDIIVANSQSHTISILLGNGDGTFKPQRTISTGYYTVSSIAVADLEGDGKPADIVVTNFQYSSAYVSFPGSSVSVLLGNGDGTFKPPVKFSTNLPGGTNYGPSSVAVADLNGDGKPDLVVTNYGYSGDLGSYAGDKVSVLLGNGNGTFQAEKEYTTSPGPISVAVADVNGDGKPDLVVADFGSQYFSPGSTVNILLGKGDGTFQPAQILDAGKYPESVAISDLNGDGKPDIIVANLGGNDVSVLQGNGDGSFKTQQTFAAGYAPPCVVAADLNGDGKPDLVVSNAGSYFYPGHTVSVLLGNSAANFTGQTYTIVPSLDTITGTTGVDQITLTASPDQMHIDWTMGGTTAEMAISDPHGLTINGNGGDDIITVNAGAWPNILHLNGTFTINGLSAGNSLANTNLEIGRSTVYFSYSNSNPLSLIQGYLRNGYNNGSWNGTASTGVITSIPAAQNALQTTAIGYADSADGQIPGQPANTVELKYTLYGDTTLTGTVGVNDFTRLTQHYHQTTGGTWDTGDFNYDGSVNFSDFTLLTRTYNTSLGSQAVPSVQASSTVTPAVKPVPAKSGTPPTAVHSKPPPSPAHHLKPASKHFKRHRR